MSKDICPICGKRLRSVVPVSAEAKVILAALVPDKDGFVFVPAGLLKYADECRSSVKRRVKRVR